MITPAGTKMKVLWLWTTRYEKLPSHIHVTIIYRFQYIDRATYFNQFLGTAKTIIHSLKINDSILDEEYKKIAKSAQAKPKNPNY